MKAKVSKKTSPKLDLERRIEQLENRPTVFNITEDGMWVVMVPETMVPDDFDSLKSFIDKYHNVALIQADDIKFLRIV